MKTFLFATACVVLAAIPHLADARRPSAADTLYAELDATALAWRTGLGQLRAGEVDAGREAVRKASAQLLSLGGRCEKTHRCDVARVFATYDSLMQEGLNLATGGEGYASAAGTGTGGVLGAMPASGRSVNMLRGKEFAALIEMNEPVRAALAEWLTWMRPSLITSWENYQQMRFLMWPEYQRAGLPEALLFGILAKESNGRVHALSRSGAAGPMQFMPATGYRFGLGYVNGFDTRYDPQLSARASVRYFNERFAELGDDLEFAIAAYNGGEGRALRLKQASGGRDFWDPAVYGQLPAETRDYVPYVLAAAWLFLHPEQYGLEFPKIDGAATVMKLAAPASIYQLSICLGGPRDGYYRALRNLNPRWEPHVPLAAGTELRVPTAVPPLYQRHCLRGERAELAVNLMAAHKPTVGPTATRQPAAAAAPSSSGGSYQVKSGDTLAAIARRHGCGDANKLARANGLRTPYVIRPGQRLRLSGCSG